MRSWLMLVLVRAPDASASPCTEQRILNKIQEDTNGTLPTRVLFRVSPCLLFILIAAL